MENMEKYMQRCIELSVLGLGYVAPNPLAGAVIVYENKIIGEGYHRRYGEAHAEVNAIQSVSEQELLKYSCLYVNLEPCPHYGKTPPCTDIIIERQIPEIVVGCIDPFSEVSGKGIEKLKKAGIKVHTGILNNECIFVNRRFFTYHQKKRPYIILKWAQTIDGFIDKKRNPDSSPSINQISNELCQCLGHKWRTQEQAIMIGTNTVLNDNPQLTVRHWRGRNPLRVIIDKNLKIPLYFNIFNSLANTLVYNAQNNEIQKNIEYKRIDFDRDILQQILNDLYERQIQSIIVEGGAMLIDSFIRRNLWDEARVFICEKFFHEGIRAPLIPLTPASKQTIKDCKLFLYFNK